MASCSHSLCRLFPAACRTAATVSPATATARAQRVIAQATDMALQLRETTLLDEKQATATAHDRLDRLARLSNGR